jgi:DNA-directed RNA polymerase specialized sigma24 family protein
MKAKEYMQQVTKLDLMIQNKQIEADQWKSIALGTTSRNEGERVKASGSQQKMADAVSRYVDIERYIDSQIDKLADLKQQIISDIEQLPAPEYDVLHKIYIQGMELDEVATAKDKSYTWVTTVHGNGLKALQKILNEREVKNG